METAILPQGEYHKAAGERLRTVIRLLGLKNTEAAKIMGISKHVLNFWMKGENPIQPYQLYRLCRSKGINFDYVALGDWSALPHRLAQVLEAELSAKLAEDEAPGQTGSGNDAQQKAPETTSTRVSIS